MVSEEAEFLDADPRRVRRRSTRSSPRRASASCSRPTTTDIGPCCPTARAAPTAALLVQQVLALPRAALPGPVPVRRPHARRRGSSSATAASSLHAGGHAVAASHVGPVHERLRRPRRRGRGRRADRACAATSEVVGTVGYMAAFVEERPRTPAAMSYIRNTTIGGDTPYVYVTRRTYDRPDGDRHADLHGRPGAPDRRRRVRPRRRRSRERCSTTMDDADPAVRPARAPAGPPVRLPVARPDGLHGRRRSG